MALAGAAPAAVAAGSVAVRGEVDNTNVALAVAIVIVLVASRDGVVAGVWAAVSGAVAFDVLQTRPYGSLRIAGTRDAITTVLLLGVGFLAGWLDEHHRSSSDRDASERRDFAHLQRFARLAAAGCEQEDLITAAEAELADLLGLIDCRVEPFPFDTTLFRLQRQPSGRHKLVVHQHEAGPAWGPKSEVELPVEARGHQLGRFVLHSRPSDFPLLFPRQAREVAFTIADRVGVAVGPEWASARWIRHHPHSVG
jgi:hypothetical protein